MERKERKKGEEGKGTYFGSIVEGNKQERNRNRKKGSTRKL